MPDTPQYPTSGKRKSQAKSKANGANLGFEEKLWQTADKLRGYVDDAVTAQHSRDSEAMAPLMPITAQDFIAKWLGVDLSERSMVQQPFLDLCALVGHWPPTEYDPTGHEFAFEMGAEKNGGVSSWADVAKIGFFGH